MTQAMKQATSYCLLEDGRLLTVQASCRSRDGRADIKCHGPREISQRIQQILRLARHTEAQFDSRQQVVISLDPWPVEGQREWELAVVLADRMVRDLYQPQVARLYAHGWSDAWELGQVQGPLDGIAQRYQTQLAEGACLLVVGGAALDSAPGVTRDSNCVNNCVNIGHLGALYGHPDPAALVSCSRTWFPLFSAGEHDSLCWVEVSVRPLAVCSDDEDDLISVTGLSLVQQQAVQQVLAAARQFEPKSTRQWRTVVRFGEAEFYGESYQLALVLADRIARGREFAPRGRLIASGRSSAWHTGQVQRVGACEAKCALILQQAARGDRVLLPAEWAAEVPPKFMAQLAAKGVSCAFVERLGLL
jgi:hypothetical protein